MPPAMYNRLRMCLNPFIALSDTPVLQAYMGKLKFKLAKK